MRIRGGAPIATPPDAMAGAQSIDAPVAWLEVVGGAAPILLIAPHGGRAGPAARATLHPKVNDLETAAITRELAHRIGAAALINAAMDRNELDCNRLSQIAAKAPWLLDLIANQVAAIVERHGRAAVLLIHGWNVIEPRVDLGLGLRERAGRLHPPAGAHVSACDDFIHGPVAALAQRLRSAGIIPTFGLRYPGGASQNLLQAFTQRHAGSPIEPLRRLADYAARGVIDALQLEMSVAVRLAGELRMRNLDALSEVFSTLAHGASEGQAVAPGTIEGPEHAGGVTSSDHSTGAAAREPSNGAVSHDHSPITVVRTTPLLRVSAKGQSGASSSAPPARVGIEFFDPAAGVGAMVSFDFGANAAGGRIMVLFDSYRAALFTGEGKPVREGARVRLGPLELNADPEHGSLNFRGAAVVVNDGAAYLSVERALAEGRLDHAMELSATLDFPSAGHDEPGLFAAHPAQVLAGDAGGGRNTVPAAIYGHLRGSIMIEGRRRPLNAIARLGFSFTGLSPQKFVTRRMLWAYLAGQQPSAIEARLLTFDDAPADQAANALSVDGWHPCELGALMIETPAAGARPDQLAAVFIDPRDGTSSRIEGVARNYMTLSRPGFGNTRIHTSLGFATYRLGNRAGAGMFEYSRLAANAAGDVASDSDAE